MSPDVVLLSAFTLAISIGWLHRRYLDESAPVQGKPKASQPVVTGREIFGNPTTSGAGCRDAA